MESVLAIYVSCLAHLPVSLHCPTYLAYFLLCPKLLPLPHPLRTWRNAQVGEKLVEDMEQKSQTMAAEMKTAIGEIIQVLPP